MHLHDRCDRADYGYFKGKTPERRKFATDRSQQQSNTPRAWPLGTTRWWHSMRPTYPLTVGVRRRNLNHVVTGNDDGTITALSPTYR
jgi:hypothetical protein